MTVNVSGGPEKSFVKNPPTMLLLEPVVKYLVCVKTTPGNSVVMTVKFGYRLAPKSIR